MLSRPEVCCRAGIDVQVGKEMSATLHGKQLGKIFFLSQEVS